MDRVRARIPSTDKRLLHNISLNNAGGGAVVRCTRRRAERVLGLWLVATSVSFSMGLSAPIAD